MAQVYDSLITDIVCYLFGSKALTMHKYFIGCLCVLVPFFVYKKAYPARHFLTSGLCKGDKRKNERQDFWRFATCRKILYASNCYFASSGIVTWNWRFDDQRDDA